jgi:hypothetical protein
MSWSQNGFRPLVPSRQSIVIELASPALRSPHGRNSDQMGGEKPANEDIARVLDRVAGLLEVQEANPFRSPIRGGNKKTQSPAQKSHC